MYYFPNAAVSNNYKLNGLKQQVYYRPGPEVGSPKWVSLGWNQDAGRATLVLNALEGTCFPCAVYCRMFSSIPVLCPREPIVHPTHTTVGTTKNVFKHCKCHLGQNHSRLRTTGSEIACIPWPLAPFRLPSQQLHHFCLCNCLHISIFDFDLSLIDTWDFIGLSKLTRIIQDNIPSQGPSLNHICKVLIVV